jgi:hypothetical protein
MSDECPREFVNADLRGSVFRDVDLTGARFEHTELSDVTMRGVEMVRVRITGEILDFVINGVDVAPLVEAELDRVHPDRVKMRPDDADGFREGYALVSGLWDGTVDRARALDPALLHESLDGEWTFTETLRHLSFATAAWVGRAILGSPAPWHPLDLPWDQMPDMDGIPRDRSARPSLDEVLALRGERRALVRDYLDSLTDEQLAEDTAPIVGPGWPREGATFPVKECLLIVLNEEWWHRQYAERDLTALESR